MVTENVSVSTTMSLSSGFLTFVPGMVSRKDPRGACRYTEEHADERKGGIGVISHRSGDGLAENVRRAGGRKGKRCV